MALTARHKGGLKFLSGTLGYAAVWALIQSTGDLPGRGGPFALIGIAAPGLLALVGAAELGTGVSLADLEKRWSSLPRWKRNVYSAAVVLGFATLLFGSLALYGYLRDG